MVPPAPPRISIFIGPRFSTAVGLLILLPDGRLPSQDPGLAGLAGTGRPCSCCAGTKALGPHVSILPLIGPKPSHRYPPLCASCAQLSRSRVSGLNGLLLPPPHVGFRPEELQLDPGPFEEVLPPGDGVWSGSRVVHVCAGVPV